MADSKIGAADPELVKAYANTALIARIDGRQVPLADFSPGKLPRSPLFVITGCNPGSRELTKDENRRRTEELADELRRCGFEHWECRGVASDGRWAEDGFAVAGIERDQAIELGARFGQFAVFEVDEQDVRVIGCLGPNAGVELAVRPRNWVDPWFGASEVEDSTEPSPDEETGPDEDELEEIFLTAYANGSKRVEIAGVVWECVVGPDSEYYWTNGQDEHFFEDDDAETLVSWGQDGNYPGGDYGYDLVARGTGELRRYAVFSWGSWTFDEFGPYASDEEAISAFEEQYAEWRPEEDDWDEDDEDEDDEDEEA